MNDNQQTDNREVLPDCSCVHCADSRPNPLANNVGIFAGLKASRTRMIVCEHCGNKRCPHANYHGYACTGSNEPGQPGSAFAESKADKPPCPACDGTGTRHPTHRKAAMNEQSAQPSPATVDMPDGGLYVNRITGEIAYLNHHNVPPMWNRLARDLDMERQMAALREQLVNILAQLTISQEHLADAEARERTLRLAALLEPRT